MLGLIKEKTEKIKILKNTLTPISLLLHAKFFCLTYYLLYESYFVAKLRSIAAIHLEIYAEIDFFLHQFQEKNLFAKQGSFADTFILSYYY